jgi:predicted metalloendopeptidase
MAQKKGYKDPFSEFLGVFEKQRKEMEKLAKPFLDYQKQMEKMVRPFLDYQKRTEKMAKPILEYHQKLLEDSKRFQAALAQNVVETMGKVINQIIEEQKKQAEEAKKLLSEVSLPTQATDFINSLQRIQESWIEHLKKATEMFEGFVKSREKGEK